MKFAHKALLATTCLWFTHSAMASSDWWFDVEVLLFDRGQAISQTEEQFEYAETLAPVSADWDLLDALLRPDISGLKQNLPICGQSASPLYVAKPSLQELIDAHQRWQQGRSPALASDDSPSALSAPALPVTPYANASIDASAQSAGEAAPDPWQIAGYWLEFNWPDTSPIKVPQTRYCEQPQPWIAFKNNQWQVWSPDNVLPSPDEVPITPQGDSADNTDLTTARILSPQANELTSLSAQVRSARGLTRLLHTTWRQPVEFGQQNAASVRVFAGKNYARQFDFSGQQRSDAVTSVDVSANLPKDDKVSEKSFFEALDAQLESTEDVSFTEMMAASEKTSTSLQAQVEKASVAYNAPIWQVDGYIRVYLKNINRVPYLHIESRMYYRQPVPMTINDIATGAEPRYKLVSVPFHQMRRVISKQLHYFDHPLFGMAIKIRRAQLPKEL